MRGWQTVARVPPARLCPQEGPTSNLGDQSCAGDKKVFGNLRALARGVSYIDGQSPPSVGADTGRFSSNAELLREAMFAETKVGDVIIARPSKGKGRELHNSVQAPQES